MVQTDAITPEILYRAVLYGEAVDTLRLYGVRPLQEHAAIILRTEGDAFQADVLHTVGDVV